jgi:anti-sigma regulatory factor (Ser/Thr protein kinase)
LLPLHCAVRQTARVDSQDAPPGDAPQPGDALTLGAEPDAAARARRFLRAVLAAAPGDLLADAELAATELVTNAQLHGAAPITVRATWAEPTVRLEVQDAGSRMPVVPARSDEAMTGRGLSLVAAVSSSWGVQPHRVGKTVWSELGGAAGGRPEGEVDLDALLAAWPDEEPVEQHFTVRLGSVPTDLLLDAKRHIDNVVRELTFERSGGGEQPPGFAALIETVTTTFAGARDGIKRQAVAGRGTRRRGDRPGPQPAGVRRGRRGAVPGRAGRGRPVLACREGCSPWSHRRCTGCSAAGTSRRSSTSSARWPRTWKGRASGRSSACSPTR